MVFLKPCRKNSPIWLDRLCPTSFRMDGCLIELGQWLDKPGMWPSIGQMLDTGWTKVWFCVKLLSDQSLATSTGSASAGRVPCLPQKETIFNLVNWTILKGASQLRVRPQFNGSFGLKMAWYSFLILLHQAKIQAIFQTQATAKILSIESGQRNTMPQH